MVLPAAKVKEGKKKGTDRPLQLLDCTGMNIFVFFLVLPLPLSSVTATITTSTSIQIPLTTSVMWDGKPTNLITN